LYLLQRIFIISRYFERKKSDGNIIRKQGLRENNAVVEGNMPPVGFDLRVGFFFDEHKPESR